MRNRLPSRISIVSIGYLFFDGERVPFSISSLPGSEKETEFFSPSSLTGLVFTRLTQLSPAPRKPTF